MSLKIKKRIRIHADGVESFLDVTMQYSAKHKLFYIPVPDEFVEAAILYNSEHDNVDYRTFQIKEQHVFSGKTEDECVSYATKCLMFFAKNAITYRDVIILRFSAKNNAEYSIPCSKEQPEQSLLLGFVYGVKEISSGSQKEYRKEYTDWQGVDTYKKIHISNTMLVLDDTPQIRARLDGLHAALSGLIAKLKEIMADNASVMKFIQATTLNLLPEPEKQECLDTDNRTRFFSFEIIAPPQKNENHENQ